ncbi:MAG: Rho termination factor N-terminal domain-containing protein, partial [Pseudonocardiaceae bacterium]
MVLAELRKLAGEMGLSGISGLRKNDLIAAIKERQGSVPKQRRADADQLPLEATVAPQSTSAPRSDSPPRSESLSRPDSAVSQSTAAASQITGADHSAVSPSGVRTDPDAVSQIAEQQSSPAAPVTGDSPDQQDRESDGMDRSRNRRRRPTRAGSTPRHSDQTQNEQTPRDQVQSDQTSREQAPRDQVQSDQPQSVQSTSGQNGARDDDDENGRRRGRRFRDRNRRTRNERGSTDRRDGGELEVREDDVLLPVAGILDVLDNYAFVRTSGYLSGPNDVYVSLSLVRKYWLRRGDAITGAVRQPRDGEQQRQKFNPLVRVDTINGLDAEHAKQRPEFTKLTPLYPNERLRLETEQHLMTTRVIDLIMPIGKGQRALIVSPPKAGKTMILQALANAITRNNPECHLMVVL